MQSKAKNPNEISISQRWVLSIILSTIAAIGATDIISDLSDGADLVHVVIECIGILASTLGIVWIWKDNIQLRSQSEQMQSKFLALNEEALQWRTRSQDFAKGLSMSIDQQLEKWKLSRAEKEVALLLLKGLSLKEISTVRSTSERTTRQQAQEVYRKSGLSGRSELAAFFLEDILIISESSPS